MFFVAEIARVLYVTRIILTLNISKVNVCRLRWRIVTDFFCAKTS